MRQTMRFLVCAALLAVGTFAASPAAAERVPPGPGYAACDSRISGNGFWTDLSVRDTRCLRGAKVARAYVRRVTNPDGSYTVSTKVINVLEFRCRLQVLQGETNPYGRVTCTQGDKRVRFYGFS